MLAFADTYPCCPGDREFIHQLYSDYERLMYATATRYISDRAACEDVIQDCIEKPMKKTDILRPMERCVLAGYIVSTVRNTAINYLKHEGIVQKRQCGLEEGQENELPAGGLPVDELIVLAERKDLLKKIWPALPEDDQRLLEGKYILGYADSELALQLGCKPDSIRMKLTRARRRALKLMQDQEGELHDET